jgi:hypothetical protein
VISNLHITTIVLCWGWNKSPFDINSVVFHVDDFNYGRRITTIFLLIIASQLGVLFAEPIIKWKIYITQLEQFQQRYCITTRSLKCTFSSCFSQRPLSNRIIQYTCNAVSTHLIHKRIFLFSRCCGVERKTDHDHLSINNCISAGRFIFRAYNKMKNIYHTVGTVPT